MLLGFHSSAQGKLALAFGPSILWERVNHTTLAQVTSKTITDLGALREDIEQIKSQGWSEAPEQSLMGVNAFAAPVLDKDGALTGIITAVGSATCLTPRYDENLRRVLLSAANEISHRLGHVQEYKPH